MHESTHFHTQPPLPATNRKELECEFHSADYHMLTEVASGLRNATEHLVKVYTIIIMSLKYYEKPLFLTVELESSGPAK